MAAAGVTLIKTFTYRGAAEEWSNQYHLTGHPGTALPADWRSLVDDLVDLEKEVYTDRVTIVRALCYTDTDNNAVYTYNLADFAGVVSGAFATFGAVTPGDVAGWVRWDTGLLNSKGKKIYLRKYFHDVEVEGPPNEDHITPTQITAYQTFGDAMLTTALNGDTFMAAPADGRQPDGPANASTYATTRTLHRRGRRP